MNQVSQLIELHWRMITRICNYVIILFLVFSVFNSCDSPSDLEGVVLEQNYSLDKDGDIIEDGYKPIPKSDEEIINNYLNKSEKREDNSGAIVSLLLGISKFFLIIAVTSLLIRHFYSKKRRREKKDLSTSPIRICPNCGGSNFMTRNSGVLNSNSNIYYKTFWCPDCGIGNGPSMSSGINSLSLTKDMYRMNSPIFISNPKEGVICYCKGIDSLPESEKFTDSNENIFLKRYGLVYNGSYYSFGFNRKKNKFVIKGTSDNKVRIFPIRGIESIDTVFKEEYCGSYCHINSDKCSSESLCPLLRVKKLYNSRLSMSQGSSIKSTDFKSKILKSCISEELEKEQCEKICPFSKGKSMICNTPSCTIRKVQDSL